MWTIKLFLHLVPYSLVDNLFIIIMEVVLLIIKFYFSFLILQFTILHIFQVLWLFYLEVYQYQMSILLFINSKAFLHWQFPRHLLNNLEVINVYFVLMLFFLIKTLGDLQYLELFVTYYHFCFLINFIFLFGVYELYVRVNQFQPLIQLLLMQIVIQNIYSFILYNDRFQTLLNYI